MANGSPHTGVSGEGNEVRSMGIEMGCSLGWKGHNHAGHSLTAETDTWDWLGFGGAMTDTLLVSISP